MLSVRATRAVLVAIGLGCLVAPVVHKLTQGWLTSGDYYLLGCAALMFGFCGLPIIAHLNLLVLLSLLFVLEGAFFALSSMYSSSPSVYAYTNVTTGSAIRQIDFFERNEDIGYQPKADIQVSVIKKLLAGRELYHSIYTIDERHRRVTPVDGAQTRTKYILFFGCSYTFGEGVNDIETIPYYFAQLVPSYRPYNYGFSGYGTQHMHARIRLGSLRGEIAEKEGIAVYLFLDDHVRRVMNTMRSTWVHHSPYYFLAPDGQLTRNGLFNTARPFTYSLYHDVLLRSNTLRMLGADVPFRVTAGDVALTCELILESYRSLREQMNNESFYFVILPGRDKSQLGRRIAPCVATSGVRIIDYTGRAWPDEFYIPGDGHLTPAGNLELAQWLAKDLASAEGL